MPPRPPHARVRRVSSMNAPAASNPVVMKQAAGELKKIYDA
jgi:hypothetical protein